MTPAKEQELKSMDISRETSGVTDYEVINIPSPPRPSEHAKLVAKIAEDMRLKYTVIDENSQTLKPEFKPVAPTRFTDKVDWLKKLYAKREKFKQQRQEEINLTNFQMADVDLRGMLYVKSNKEKELELERAEALAREENAIMKEWEIINDRNLYNSKCIENIENNNLLQALEYSRLYRKLCLHEKYEDALMREKEILRIMGKDFRIGAGSKEGSKKYKIPIEIHNDLLKLNKRNKNDPVATLVSPRKFSPVYRNKQVLNSNITTKPISPVKKIIINLDNKHKKASERIRSRRNEKKAHIGIVKRNLVSLNKSKIFLQRTKPYKLNSTSMKCHNPYINRKKYKTRDDQSMMHNIFSRSRGATTDKRKNYTSKGKQKNSWE